jgi:hypothetical protein
MDAKISGKPQIIPESDDAGERTGDTCWATNLLSEWRRIATEEETGSIIEMVREKQG